MTTHDIAASMKEWTEARKALLEKEKAFSKQGDALAAERRALPWLEVTEDYVFDTPSGRKSLAELFGDKSQLLVYHFMFGPDWEKGCQSCSFWTDHFSGAVPHLAARDVAFVSVSRAPLAKLEAFAERMGWSHPWVSSEGSTFNFDFGVSFRPDEEDATYNFGPKTMGGEELPGFTAFFKDESGRIFRTYSCYARGLDALNPTYAMLDRAPKGRDEDGLPYTMSWVRLKDEYGT
ncbi:MAG: thioredoxin family protein [Polyangiaceae bacterium]